MKHTNYLTKTPKGIALTAIACVLSMITVHAQEKPADEKPAAEKAGAIEIVFVPQNIMAKSKQSGKLKENTFYWSHADDDVAAAPKPITEDGKSFLQLVGYHKEPEKVQRHQTKVSMSRAFNVPKNATGAKLVIQCRYDYDPWGDPIATSGKPQEPQVGMEFTREGKGLHAGNFKIEANSDWQTKGGNPEIVKGSDQLVVTIQTHIAQAVDIAVFDVQFTTD